LRRIAAAAVVLPTPWEATEEEAESGVQANELVSDPEDATKSVRKIT